MNVYGHVTLDDKRDALDKLGDSVRGGREMTRLLSPVAVSQRPEGSRLAVGRGPGNAKPQVSGVAACGCVLRACRDSNPKPSDP